MTSDGELVTFKVAGTSTLVTDLRMSVEINAIRVNIRVNEINIKRIDKSKQLSDILTNKGASPTLDRWKLYNQAILRNKNFETSAPFCTQCK